MDWQRRDFLTATAAGMGILILPDWAFADGDAPSDNPAEHLKLGWTGSYKSVWLSQGDGDRRQLRLQQRADGHWIFRRRRDLFSQRHSGNQPCRNLTIVNNITRSNGILIAGSPATLSKAMFTKAAAAVLLRTKPSRNSLATRIMSLVDVGS